VLSGQFFHAPLHPGPLGRRGGQRCLSRGRHIFARGLGKATQASKLPSPYKLRAMRPRSSGLKAELQRKTTMSFRRDDFFGLD
jgi:hypothetical protein